ncbi:CoxG family protein [Pararhodobacter oceanensis]|uniref:Carbon monoxide dehydrogenase n=1 Tax=Pararhodobacter oceanensis TaxID=2172121 RepID=A0A2T8HRZ2_9RHOB|nr:carbon monoxide dehydrogenase subunit G [Pararhodobacter oceanensis]PVH28198.1 carbon monoxide dehydrogenase [Pararhodobacter oceanensis]
MQMNDNRTIAADPAIVWAALLDPEVLKACVPGCEELTGSAAEGFEAVVVQKVGPVKAKFAGQVSVTDIIEGQSLTLNGEGKGGAAGFAKGAAHVTLAPATAEDGSAATLLTYEVEAKVGGKLAQLGSRIIDGFARKMADEFFGRFQDALESPEEEDTEASEGEGDAPEGAKKGWFRKMFKGD